MTDALVALITLSLCLAIIGSILSGRMWLGVVSILLYLAGIIVVTVMHLT